MIHALVVRPVMAQACLTTSDELCSVSTRIGNLTAASSADSVTVTGSTEYRDPNLGTFSPLTGVKVTLSWWQSSASSSSYMGEVYSDDSTGDFSYTWVGTLEPGLYYINAAYAGGDEFQVPGSGNATYDFGATETNTQLLVPLQLSMSIDNPTLSIGQGDSATVIVTVTAQNSKNAYPISLSLTSSNQLFATQTFSPQSGSTPLTSKLSLNVLNVTQPGTYTMTVIATSQQGDLPGVTVSSPLQILVQQNTHVISVNVEGLPTNVQTPLYVDSSRIENVTSGAVTLTISNNASLVSVDNEIVLGDTRYICEVYSQSASDQSITSFTFVYGTEYRFTVKADLPQTVVIATLNLNVNGTDYSQSNIRPTEGFSNFFPQNSIIDFGFTPSEIPTNNTVNYNFTAWKDLTTGDMLTPSNATSSGLYQITLTRPYYLEADYEELALVYIKTNLPPDMMTTISFGMVGGANQTANLPGSASYTAGPFLAGTTFELNLPQSQLVLYDAAGDTRYEFQGMSPVTPMILTKHTTIQLNYAAEYRVSVVSVFPSVTIQPAGGIGWYSAGDMATVQVSDTATNQYGIPYVFAGWGGAVASNDTELSFPVMGPMAVEAQWRPNWTYLLLLCGVGIGTTIPVAIFAKRNLGRAVTYVRSQKKKKVPKKQPAVAKAAKPGEKEGERDMKLYNYIIDQGGSISIAEATKELGLTREELTQSIERLKENHMLG